MQKKDRGPIILDEKIKKILNKVFATSENSEKDRDDITLYKFTFSVDDKFLYHLELLGKYALTPAP